MRCQLPMCVYAIRVDTEGNVKRPFNPLLPQGTIFRICRDPHRMPWVDGEFVTIQLDDGDIYNVDVRYLALGYFSTPMLPCTPVDSAIVFENKNE